MSQRCPGLSPAVRSTREAEKQWEGKRSLQQPALLPAVQPPSCVGSPGLKEMKRQDVNISVSLATERLLNGRAQVEHFTFLI